jgi:uncharacterized membrane protein YkvA (DUF1232 family)
MSGDVDSRRVVSFYRSLQARVEEWLASEEASEVAFAELYAYLPALYVFLVRLALDASIPEGERAAVLSALKYIVAPYDLVPEGVVGTSGFRDDLLLAAMVVDRLFRVLPEDALTRHWTAPVDPRQVASTILGARPHLVSPEIATRLEEWLPPSHN